ncbi:MAG: putative transcriptional regulator [Candidatus Methanoperedens nitroreducens]|uniref:Putative transcriptional regulator n=1 Tax=Candidatus Methanoperedens nitratireducens TaxID=1392998 RepID=A0A0P8CG22_9EURY|nr:response regulator [Candidatus Methanoperedens sp. BLZ2]KAB2944506.1 MAG: response regulator [Candidatus Methanoperedens sp.]KPQ41600.1 MAG: putative transcriptional regulator [Candidatus Methanoperedens sp. BLZ1]MBZ0176294.1 response regulator [Candidatus Methanoperedens nitroreducens]CAG0989448.1 putative transcriptional regulatory protein pdtaR [Methanosarcinales archaeon]MCX9077227.1 response regulator [Candidatus Methanoperedens sp.]
MTADKQILVVEDEVIVGIDIQRRLKNLGYTVPVVVSSGKEAIAKVRENNPDLVLMDINLYGKMDGIEAASKIHSFSDIPVIYLTAYTDDKTLERAKITEPYAYIIKPFKDRELQINLEIAFYKSRMEKMLKESYENLRKSKQWLAAAIDSIGDAVIATDEKGIIKLINPIAQMMTGWKEEDALGKDLITVFNIVTEGTGEQVEDPVKKVIREGIFYGLADHTILVTKIGSEIPVDIIGSPIKDEGNIIGVVLVFYDILERKKIERGLKNLKMPEKIVNS